MSNQVLHQSAECGATTHSDEVHRQPMYLDFSDRPVFGWLHCHASEHSHRHGVVICPPIGFEQVHAHRSLRHLADRLASLKIPAFRFDWHGTGDSSGNDCEPERLKCWQDDVRAAIRWMKESAGCASISVVGLRLGATIAATALGNGDVSVQNLVLWAPIISGRSFLRELKLIEMTSSGVDAVPSEPAGCIDAAGFRLTAESAASVTRCSLIQSRPRAERILLCDRDDVVIDTSAFDDYRDSAVPTERVVVPGTALMLDEPHHSEVPTKAIETITGWINETIVERHRDSIPAKFFSESEFGSSSIDIDNTSGDSFHEELFRISSSPDLFGVLTRPIEWKCDDRPLVVLLNSGAVHHVGPGRIYVELARRLASCGFASLRVDLCGLGDSIADRGEPENVVYVETMFRDIEITLKQCQSRLGIRRCVLTGICSGAYAAFQSAAQFDDPTIVESLLINPLTFTWQDGMTLETSPTLEMIEEHHYLQSAVRPDKWFKLLAGRSRIGIAGAVRLLARRLWQRQGKAIAPTTISDPIPRDFIRHPAHRDVAGDLNKILAMGRHLSMIFSTSDPGYGILTRQAGQLVSDFLRKGHLEISFIDHADHTFSRRTPRNELFERIANHLAKRYAN